MPAPTVIYRPASGAGYDFELKSTPIASKSDWGIDTLTADHWGAAPGLVAFVGALAQGLTTTYNGQTWYLKNWSDDKDQVYPTVSLTYIGLFIGVPTELVSVSEITQTGTISTTSPEEATRTFTYRTFQTVTRYITTVAPTSATNTTPAITADPVIFKSEIRTASGALYLGSVPAALLTALTPSGTDNQTTLSYSQPVAGVALFECEDVCTALLPSN
jgi:hypothetical protein